MGLPIPPSSLPITPPSSTSWSTLRTASCRRGACYPHFGTSRHRWDDKSFSCPLYIWILHLVFLLLLPLQANKSKLGTALKMISGPPAEEDGDWFEGLEGWSQVFRLRYGSKQQQETMVQSKPGTRVRWRGGEVKGIEMEGVKVEEG